MAPKKKDPPSGQRSIATFFSPKPRPVVNAKDGSATSHANKISKPAGAGDTAEAKAANVPRASPKAQATPAPKPATASTAELAALATAAPAVSAAAAAPATDSDGGAHVGKSIRVYWTADKAWYEGSVTEFNGCQHLVVYEDGDEEWLELKAEKFEFVDAKPAGANKGAAGKKRKAKVVESDSDEESVPESGSDYQASMHGDESEDESLADEADSDAASPASANTKTPASRPSKKRGASSKAKSASTAAKPAPAPAGTTAKKAVAAATPGGVALDNSLGLTPGTAGGADAASTAKGLASGRPPRPPMSAKTPGTSATPRSGTMLRSALDGVTPGGTTPGSALKDAMAADADRFSARETQRFPFLHPDNIRDAQKRRPGQPGYDPNTVFVPPDWIKDNRVSEGQKQWWEFKSRNFDSVLLFKMGKFYELFEMDAHVGAEVLGLSYMKGDQPHCGFPEAAYHQMAETLARAGRKVVVIEQVETPAQLEVRNDERRKQGLKKEMVVRRSKVAVLTRGTLTDPEMLGASPDAVFLMSLAELPVPASVQNAEGPAEDGGAVRPRVWLGACAVDVATGQMLVGQWMDDDMRSQLRNVLTALQPAEVVLPKGELSGSSRKVLLGMLRNPRVNELVPGDRFWGAERAWEQLARGGYFDGEAAMPPVLQMMHGDQEGYRAAGTALGGCLSYLQDVLLDKQVLSAGRVELLAEAFGVGAARGGERGPTYMALDGAALENMEVLENGEGGLVGTLLAAMDNCVTPAGRRRLRQWLCRPLFRISEIVERQDAVQDLMGPAEEAAGQARKLFAGLADLERALARLTAAGAGHGSAREGPQVVLYEDVAKKRVQGFAAVLRGLHRIQEAMQLFQDLGEELSSSLLRELTTPGAAFPDMEVALRDMREATDWEEAEQSGRVVPREGVDEAFDEAEGAVAVAEQDLAEYLKEVRGEVRGCGPREVNYVSLNKDSHVLELPESAHVPSCFEPMQGKKGVKRYTSPDLRQLVKAREEAFDQRERALSGILQGLMRLFADRKEVWAAAVDCTAQLDALMSLAVAASCSGGPMCRPNLIPWDEADGGSPLFRAKGLCHPAGITGTGGAFVPNDVELGGEASPFVVLTGPNMGGKSTLLRQVCLACLMAQVGAWVPADSLDLSPVDSVYVRMGARDRIMLGQSTFFVELAETSAALNRATSRSLVALDELGRGTATSDGTAIAAAVLDFLAKTVKCRGLFATHYHRLSDSHADDPDVALKHMACEVTPAEDGGVDEVTFLYKLVAGACPKSYGVNVARLAGLPDSVVRRAAQVAEQLESQKGLAAATSDPKQAQQECAECAEAMEVDAGGEEAGAPEGWAQLARRVVAAVQQAGEGGAGLERLLKLQGEARQQVARAAVA